MDRALTAMLICEMVFIINGQAQTPTDKVIINFSAPRRGANPNPGLIRDNAGNLYGTTLHGGAGGQGVVFKVDKAGHQKLLYSFTGGPDGGQPYGGLVRDAAGNLYGATSGGGINNFNNPSGFGVIFKVDPSGNETVLYSFTGGADGAQPYAGLVQDVAGNFYGTTTRGGVTSFAYPDGYGVVFKLDASGNETVIHAFMGGDAGDGSGPTAGVTFDPAGNLYGTTSEGGLRNMGVVYKVDPSGNETVLTSFEGYPQGGPPTGDTLLIDAGGNLYGSAEDYVFGGGPGDLGVVYTLSSSGSGFKALHNFRGGDDGGGPNALLLDRSGSLLGCASAGGAGRKGIIYRMDLKGHLKVLFDFPESNGGSGPNNLVRDAMGNLYGTTWQGGQGNEGTVFKVDTARQETVLYVFPGPLAGAQPTAGLLPDGKGGFYGTASEGGTHNNGLVFEVDRQGHQTVLYNFTGRADGGSPRAGLIRDSAGNLYGTATFGGTANSGVIYKLDTQGRETVLYNFSGGPDGGLPWSKLVRDPAGNLYGTTFAGGVVGNENLEQGVIFKLDTAGNLTVLHTFTGQADGGSPFAGMIRDADGTLYGTGFDGGTDHRGVVYKIDRAGNEVVLYSFTGANPNGSTDGAFPMSSLLRDSAGNLYGTTKEGGTFDYGTVFKVDKTGHETILYNFTGGADGCFPQAGLISDGAGNLYGTTYGGGTATTDNGYGVVFKLDPAGQETVLFAFDGPNGGHPWADLTMDADGAIFGTTYLGGGAGEGVLYRIRP